MEREQALHAYQEQMEVLKERFESDQHEQVQESIREILIESSRKGTSEYFSEAARLDITIKWYHRKLYPHDTRGSRKRWRLIDD